MRMGEVGPNHSSNDKLSFLHRNPDTKPGRFPGHREIIRSFDVPRDPLKTTRVEYNQFLQEATGRVLDDNKLIDSAVSAITAYVESKDIILLAKIQNELSSILINLNDVDIDIIINKFGKKVLERFKQPNIAVELSSNHIEKLQSGAWGIGDQDTLGTGRNEVWGFGKRGIKSVIHFVRERTKLLLAEPTQQFELGYNNFLDSVYSTDIIEVIVSPENGDLVVNLVQIKSSTPRENEIEKIERDHRRYVQELMSFSEVKDIEVPEQRQIFEETLNNQVLMIEKIFELCTSNEKAGGQSLEITLGLDKLNLIQKAWILDTYYEIIVDQITTAYKEGYIDTTNMDELLKNLRSLRDSYVNKSGLPTRLMKIKTINSIVSVDHRIIHQKTIYDATGVSDGLAATF